MGGQPESVNTKGNKLAKTLFLITGASLLTRFPFQIVNMLPFLRVRIPPFGILFVIKLLQFSNSLVNVIIYPFRIPEFKGALLRMLRGFVISSSRKTNNNYSMSSASSVPSWL